MAARSAATAACCAVDQRLVGVDRALRDEVLRQQVAAARELALRVGERRLVLRSCACALARLASSARAVEREQQLAGLHELAFADVHLRHHAAHLGADLDGVERAHRAGGREQHRPVAPLGAHGGDAHRRRRRGGARRRALPTPRPERRATGRGPAATTRPAAAGRPPTARVPHRVDLRMVLHHLHRSTGVCPTHVAGVRSGSECPARCDRDGAVLFRGRGASSRVRRRPPRPPRCRLPADGTAAAPNPSPAAAWARRGCAGASACCAVIMSRSSSKARRGSAKIDVGEALVAVPGAVRLLEEVVRAGLGLGRQRLAAVQPHGMRRSPSASADRLAAGVHQQRRGQHEVVDEPAVDVGLEARKRL